MEEEKVLTEVSAWDESHPWLSRMTAADDEDPMDDDIRYTLDELRFA